MFRLDQPVPYEALFASDLQPSQNPSPAEIRTAVSRTIRALGVVGCVGQVGQEFGDHPGAAIARMRWARDAVARAYGAAADEVASAPAPRTDAHDRISG